MRYLGYKGSHFTWKNCIEGENFIKARLDRVVANRGWCEGHQLAQVWVLASKSSDHKPINLRMREEEVDHTVYSKKFKIEAPWMVDEEYKHIVEEPWGSGGLRGTKMQLVRQKLANCQSDLSTWSSRKFGDAAKKIK